jgi:phytoene synthase
MPDPTRLAASYLHCRRVARAAARNFYYGISLLPAEKRDALCAIYAFMREADDISDSSGALDEKQQRLAAYRGALDRALAGEFGSQPAWPAFHHAVAQYRIPSRYLHDLISGTEMDLTVSSYPTFDRLREYCYRVAGTVGLTCIHVFGFEDQRAPGLAEKLGIAFQLTNILRDLPEDAAMGRFYLPQEDLDRFGVNVAELSGPRVGPALWEMMQFETRRAWEFYEEGLQLLPLIHRDSRAALWALARVYSGILIRIEASGYDVFSARPSLSTAEKTWIMLRARVGWWSADEIFQERDRHRRRAGGAFVGRRAG